MLENNKLLLVVKQRAIPFSTEFRLNLIIFLGFTCLTGTVSGLAVGYLSIDSFNFRYKNESWGWKWKILC